MVSREGGYPPGVWVDDAGRFHFDIEAMVRGAGYEPTVDNLRAMEKAAQDMAAKVGATVEERTDPTTERLARALEEAGAPADMIERARQGYYDDFKSPLAFPEMQLLADARAAGLETIAEGVMAGEWDATKEESDEWARSPEGQAAFQELVNSRPNRAERRHPKP